MKIITVPSLAIAYLTVFPITVGMAQTDRRNLRIELPLPEHCANVTDTKLPSGVCVRGPLHYRLLPGTGEILWRELGINDASEFFKSLDADKFGSSSGE